MEELTINYKNRLIKYSILYKKLERINAPESRWQRNYEKFETSFKTVMCYNSTNKDVAKLKAEFARLNSKFLAKINKNEDSLENNI